MADFSWDYVTHTASEAMAQLGRSVAETIAQAVEPGIYLVEPDIVYEVRMTKGGPVVLRNGRTVAGPEVTASNEIYATIAAEMAGVVSTIDIRTTVEIAVSV